LYTLHTFLRGDPNETSFRYFRICILVPLCIYADDALKTIQNPNGGTIVYSPLSGQTMLKADDLANALVNANPNEFQVVPSSQYIQGVDF